MLFNPGTSNVYYLKPWVLINLPNLRSLLYDLIVPLNSHEILIFGGRNYEDEVAKDGIILDTNTGIFYRVGAHSDYPEGNQTASVGGNKVIALVKGREYSSEGSHYKLVEYNKGDS